LKRRAYPTPDTQSSRSQITQFRASSGPQSLTPRPAMKVDPRPTLAAAPEFGTARPASDRDRHPHIVVSKKACSASTAHGRKSDIGAEF